MAVRGAPVDPRYLEGPRAFTRHRCGRTIGVRRRAEISDRYAGRIDRSQAGKVGTLAQYGAHPNPEETGQRRVRPSLVIGATYRPGQDRHGSAGKPGTLDRGDQLDRRFADQTHRGGSVMV